MNKKRLSDGYLQLIAAAEWNRCDAMADYDFADAHCHLESCAGGFMPTILHITCGYSHASNQRNGKIAEENENAYLCAGIAPQEAMKHPDIKIKLVEWEEEIAAFPKLVAIGEIGLDYHWAKTEEEKFLQQEAFISQLAVHPYNGFHKIIGHLDIYRVYLYIFLLCLLEPFYFFMILPQ